MKIKELGEFGLIERITKKPKNKDIIVGIGDDAAVVKTKKALQVLTTDALVEGDHFRREWFLPKQIGMKAIEINVSDVASMGAIPKYALVSLALPNDLDVEFIDGLYDGMWKTCDKYDIEIIGGNMAHSKEIVISITLTGVVDKNHLCLRSGAKPGDFILVSGPLGNGRAGLRVFQESLKGFEKVKKAYLEPKAQLKFALKVASYVNSMEDISDGLASELKHICKQSKCGAIIYKDKIPINDDVRKIAKTLGEDEYDYALYGGEDFELVFTVSKNNIEKIKGYLIGEITKDKKVMLSHLGKTKNITSHGYDHFLNSGYNSLVKS
ncbi:MAG: thiamine-phosphate kinase [Candidatus Thermoplasmatota archaeon]|jgi:thiamine-monophosphate kinase|nr:thiamine-phosphate kinase [Candidatus Thermoplasmatota archaeon]